MIEDRCRESKSKLSPKKRVLPLPCAKFLLYNHLHLLQGTFQSDGRLLLGQSPDDWQFGVNMMKMKQNEITDFLKVRLGF